MQKIIGNNCKLWRVNHGYFQMDVANDTHYSIENVSSFENGRNDNYRILLWYILHGMTISDILKGVNEYGKKV